MTAEHEEQEYVYYPIDVLGLFEVMFPRSTDPRAVQCFLAPVRPKTFYDVILSYYGAIEDGDCLSAIGPAVPKRLRAVYG